MTITFPKLENREQLFFLSYGLYLTSAILYTSMFSVYIHSFYKYILFLALIICAMNELMSSKYSISAFLIAIIAGLLTFAVSFMVDNSILFVCTIVFMYCSRNIDFKKIAQITLWIMVPILLFVVLSSSLGLIENYVAYTGGRTRAFLGFRYALYLPTYVYNITALEIYIKQDKIKVSTLFILFLINFLAYYFTRSRLSWGLAIITILIAAFMKVWPKLFYHRSVIYRFLTFSFIFWFIICIIMVFNYNPSISWEYSLNQFLGNRISFAQDAINQYGFSIFGQTIRWVGNGLNPLGIRQVGTYLYVDCLYLKLPINFGIIFTIFYIFFHTYMMICCYRQKNYYLLILLALLSVHVAIDDLSIYLHYNTFWLAFGVVFQNNNKYKRNLKNDNYLESRTNNFPVE